QGIESVGQRGDIASGNQDPFLAICDGIGNAADGRRNHGQTGRDSFQQAHWQALRVRGQHKEIRLCQKLASFPVVDPSRQQDLVLQVQLAYPSRNFLQFAVTRGGQDESPPSLLQGYQRLQDVVDSLPLPQTSQEQYVRNFGRRLPGNRVLRHGHPVQEHFH